MVDRRDDRPELSRRRLLAAGAGAAALAAGALSGCTVTRGEPPIATAGQLGKKAATRPNGRPRAHVIEMYNLFGGTNGQGINKVAAEFEAAYPDIGVKITFAPQNGATQQKLLTAVAGHQPPDVAHLVPLQTPQWAAMGIMTDLTPYFERDGLKLDDFLGPAVESMVWNDKVWQLNWDADPNFPFFWNKGLFEANGLDPDRPPQTTDEVDEYNAKLLKKTGNRVTQVGLTPWDNYGYSNSLYTWGFAFGGQFRVPGTDQVTPDDEGVVKALEWIVKSAKSVGGPDAVSIAPPSLAVHPFSTGRLGMAPLVAPNLADVMNVAPDIKIGADLLPYGPPGGTKLGQGAWVGGWSTFIPRYAREPDAAWEFIKWWAATEAGTASSWKNVGFPPAWKPSSAFQDMKNDPVNKPYYDTLFSTTNARPPVLVADFYTAQMDDQVSRAVYGQVTPLQALRSIKEATMTELARFQREVRPA